MWCGVGREGKGTRWITKTSICRVSHVCSLVYQQTYAVAPQKPQHVCSSVNRQTNCDVPPISKDGRSQPGSLQGDITEVKTHNTLYTKIK
jgi:hypothetical protein